MTDAGVSLQGLLSNSCTEFGRVFHLAMTNIVARDSAGTAEWPETLHLERQRFTLLGTRFHADVAAAVVLVTIDTALKSRVHCPLSRLQMMQAVSGTVLENHAPGNTVQAALDELAREAVFASPDAQSVGEMLKKHVQPSHAVYRTLVSRSMLLYYSLIARRPGFH